MYVVTGTSGGTRRVILTGTGADDTVAEWPGPVSVAVASSVAVPGDPAVFQHVDVPEVWLAAQPNGVQCGAFAPVRAMVSEVMATGNVTVTVTGLTVPSLMAA